jgi:hypothetical protein
LDVLSEKEIDDSDLLILMNLEKVLLPLVTLEITCSNPQSPLNEKKSLL